MAVAMALAPPGPIFGSSKHQLSISGVGGDPYAETWTMWIIGVDDQLLGGQELLFLLLIGQLSHHLVRVCVRASVRGYV